MKKYVINNNQKGLLFKNGKFVKLLEAGKYTAWGNSKIEVLNIGERVASRDIRLKDLLKNEEVAAKTTSIKVGEDEVALVFVDGVFKAFHLAGEYAYFNELGDIEVKKDTLSNHEVSLDIPDSVWGELPANLFTTIRVPAYHVGRLCFEEEFVRFLEPGVYHFWGSCGAVSARVVDTRLTQAVIRGQEVLTSDKVLLRISLVCNVRVTDFEKAFSEVDDYMEQIHTRTQLALREYVARYTLDEILEGKDGISSFIEGVLKEAQAELHVEITSAGVRDIILPGDVRDILNTVLVAQKKAQASMISRREEVASTRALLNTAKLMEDNPTLMMLKQFEYAERILSNANSITLSGNSDVASQILGLVKRD